jgi:hypothetical protein
MNQIQYVEFFEVIIAKKASATNLVHPAIYNAF